MRYICFFSALVLLFIGFFYTAAADDALPKAVQDVIDQIKERNGQCTLTPENTIKTIKFDDGSKLDAEMFDIFAQQADLESLVVSGYRGLNDVAVAKLTGLKKLKTLGLTNSGISNAAIKTIAESFPDLVNLDVSQNSRLTDSAAREIAKLKNLETLGLLLCDFGEFGIMSLSSLPKLRAVDIRGNMKLGDGAMATLAKLPALRSLKHRSPAISDVGIKSLTEAKALDNLEIQDLKITGKSGEYIRQMEKLTSLIIFRCDSFDSEGVLALKGLKLNRLTLRGLPVNDSALEVFSELPTLKRLYLHELFSVSDAGMENIAHLKNLEILDIWAVPMTDQSMKTIANLTTLKTISLRGTKVTDAGLDVLLSMPALESVTLKDNPDITPDKIQKLRDAEKFKVLP
ncbi:MAG: hypothetical protein LBI05_05285 [Planctomycetaceae bacterium]|nr:hypothetical protein [Planctomycetaceae bacterium]